VAPTPERQTSDAIPIEGEIAPGAMKEVKIPFAFQTFIDAQELQGVVRYLLQGQEESSPFTLKFHPSAFILPEPLDRNEVLAVLRTEATETRSSQPIAIPISRAAPKICAYFRVKVIEQEENKVLMYGKTIQKHHVAFLVKNNPEAPQELVVAVKSNSAPLAASLIAELQELRF